MELQRLKKHFAQCRIDRCVIWTPNRQMYVSLPECSDKWPVRRFIVADNGLTVIITNKIFDYSQIKEIKQIKFYDSIGKEIC